MAEIKIDLINYCNVNMSSPNSCNSSNLNQQTAASLSDEVELANQKAKLVDVPLNGRLNGRLNGSPSGNHSNGNTSNSHHNSSNRHTPSNVSNGTSSSHLDEITANRSPNQHVPNSQYTALSSPKHVQASRSPVQNQHPNSKSTFKATNNSKFYVNSRSADHDEQFGVQSECIDQSNDFDQFMDRKSQNTHNDTAPSQQQQNHQQHQQQQNHQTSYHQPGSNNQRLLNSNFITNEDIGQLLKAFQDKAFKSGEYRAKDEKIQFMCLNLFNYDYKPDELMIINNLDDLSSSYPLKIIIPKSKAHPIDTERLRNLILKAKYARARCRFPAPVILFNNKYICRSATLSHCIEIYSRQSYASFFKSGEEQNIPEMAEISEMNLDSLESPNFDVIDTQFYKDQSNDRTEPADRKPGNNHNSNHSKSNGYFSAFRQDYSHTVNEARTHDISLLNYLKVKHIIDLMVEMKKVKYGIYVASSEKADKLKRYRDFSLNVLPYPGCEFFKLYRDNNYQAEGLVYDWKQSFVDADLSIPDSDVLKELNIDFENYKSLDVNNLTLNYLKLILSYMVEPSSESILLHCISGWDRTSLVLSLIRLSLWADYELHPNLNYEQILYLTLGYDWYLFGHDLNDRVEKGEEIMHYCFYFLKFLSSTEYSIDYLRKNIVKKGDEYVRVRFNCCGLCKDLNNKEFNDSGNKNEFNSSQNEFNGNKNEFSNKNELSTLELEEEISSSMYSSQASTVVNNNLRKEQVLSQFNPEEEEDESDTNSLCSDDHTPRDHSGFNGCFLAQQQEQPLNGKDDDEDVVDHPDLMMNSTMSTKTFVIDPTFDANISASPSSFSAFKDLRNNSATSLNRNSLTIENTADLSNRFDVISLDDQSLSSNSSYDVLHNKHQQAGQTAVGQKSQQTTPTNQPIQTNGSQCSPNQPLAKNPHSNQQPNRPTNGELVRKDSFSCGSPPQLINIASNIPGEIANDEDDLLSSSEEGNTLAEDTVDTVDSLLTATNIQRSNAVAIPSRNRSQSKFANASNDQLNWSNDYGSNASNLSNASNRLSDQSFNSNELNRCDSWQMVTDTGSIRDKTFLSSTSLDEIKRNMNLKMNNSTGNHHSSSSKFRPHQHQHYVATCCCKSINCGKHCEKVEKFNKENDLEKFVYTRKKRLSDVRVVFYQCYSRYIGLSTPNGNEITAKFSNLFNKTCEKIKFGYSNGFSARNGATRSSRKTNQFQSYIEDESIDLPSEDKDENAT